MRLNELGAGLVIQQPRYFSLILNRVERRTCNKDVPAFDQVAEFLVKQRKQQALDV